MDNNSQVPDILARIVDTKRAEVAASRGRVDEWCRAAAAAPPARDFRAALGTPGLAVVAEVKKASPSAGVIAADIDPRAVAAAYAAGGADAISVLTDETYFHGHIDYLAAIRGAVATPLLRKDFIIDASQVYQARAVGADSFLLIAAILDDSQLKDFLELGRGMGMEALVEIRDEPELARAATAGATLIGVNNRDLRDFSVDLGTAERLAPLFPASSLKVAESGIHSPDAARRMAAAGFDAILVGQSLMTAGLEGCGARISQFKTAAADKPNGE